MRHLGSQWSGAGQQLRAREHSAAFRVPDGGGLAQRRSQLSQAFLSPANPQSFRRLHKWGSQSYSCDNLPKRESVARASFSIRTNHKAADIFQMRKRKAIAATSRQNEKPSPEQAFQTALTTKLRTFAQMRKQ